MSWSNGISVAILCFINLINYMDRFTVAGVLEKVQKHFNGLNDSEAGLLQTSFIISYMIMAPVFGYMGDRHSRKAIIAGGVLFWSAMTLAGSFVPSSAPWAFFFIRALVGVGEASYSTIAPTLIGDMFAGEMRTRMLALFFFAIPVGSGLGYVAGSGVADATGEWQWALRVTPPLGAIAVLLTIFVLKDPPRGHSDGATQHTAERTSIKDDILYLLKVPSYIWSTLGFTSVCFAVGALSWWAPKYMEYAYKVAKSKMSSQTINLIFGAITCVGGILGVILGSGLAQWYRKRNPRADPIICGAGVLLSVPFSFIGLAVAHKVAGVAWLTIFVAITFLCINWTLAADILLYVITPNRRSFAQAMQILVAHLLGDAASPYVVGTISDALRHSDTDDSRFFSLQYALYSTAVVLVLGGLAFLYTARFIVSDKEICRLRSTEERRSQAQSMAEIDNSDYTYGTTNQGYCDDEYDYDANVKVRL